MMLHLAVIGVGTVGSRVLDHILNHPNSAQLFRIVAVANSRQLITSVEGVSCVDWSASSPLQLDSITAQLAPLRPHAVVVDCTSSQDIASHYPAWLNQGIHIVTPNKKAFSSEYSLFQQVVQASRTLQPLASSSEAWVLFESTVGAGLPLINTVRDLVRTGDTITHMQGILSGTLAYLFNEYCPLQQADAVFSRVVKEARANGYTEPDPRDDLNGMDVARKVVILCRLAGKRLELQDVRVQNLIPADLQAMASVGDFMDQLHRVDEHYEQLKAEAYKQGGVLRYVASMDLQNNDYQVALNVYPQHHPLAQAGGSDNVLRITSSRFPNGLEIKGAGAGADVTAFGVHCDLYRLADILS